MNAENLRRVADAIEGHEIEWLGFNMTAFRSDCVRDTSGHGCWTTACVAGWAVEVLGGEKHDRDVICTWRVAAGLLDLTSIEVDTLFYDCPHFVKLSETTPAMAVRTLRYAADHGVVDWDAANPSEVA